MDCGALTSGPVKDRQVGELTGDHLNPLDLSSVVHTMGGRPNKLDLTERPRPRRKQEMEKDRQEGSSREKEENKCTEQKKREQ